MKFGRILCIFQLCFTRAEWLRKNHFVELHCGSDDPGCRLHSTQGHDRSYIGYMPQVPPRAWFLHLCNKFCRKICKFSVRKNWCKFILQFLSLHAPMTIFENFFFYGYLFGMSTKEIKERANDLISFLELPDGNTALKILR